MKQANNEKGLTLVEVLAALVILGILFVGIMTIFPQMTLFNAKTEAKLDTMNLARQEISQIIASEKWINLLVPDYLAETKIAEEMAETGYSATAENYQTYFRYQKQGDYRYEADVYKTCETDSPTEVQCAVTDKIKLYKVHLKVYEGNRLSSETFSYISYKAESPGE